MKKFLLHSNGSAGNHGCEAIIRSTIKNLNLSTENSDYITYNEDDELKYGLDKEVNLITCKRNIPRGGSMDYYISRIIQTAFYKNYLNKRIIGDFFSKIDNYEFALALGGDNYCYKNSYQFLGFINKQLFKRKIKSVLWGVSIEPENLLIKAVQNDIQRYYAIVARESITYEALKSAGFGEKSYLFPDPAFTLDRIDLPIPDGFATNNTIGINVSPLIQSLDKGQNITLRNYECLINYIIEKTEFQIALIPHVAWEHNNDLDTLKILYEKFKETGRVILINDQNAMVLKGFIARCRMFIGARTHATIAAYSSILPTLVVGYSVKAMGIAKDIFGTHENYVIPVQSLQKETDLTNAFIWMQENEFKIKNHLSNFMPGYIEKAWEASKIIL